MRELTELKAAGDSAAAAIQRRNELIVEFRREGRPWAQIADAVGLSSVGVQKIARRLNGGELPKAFEKKD